MKLEYDRKQITIPEALGTISFEMEVLRTEDMYLEMKRGSIESEELENIHEIMYLKGKLLHLHRLWGTLGVFDSVNFLKNFSVCKQGFIGSDHIVEWDSPLRNLKELDSFEEMGVFLKELFIWMPKFILLTTVLINFCRPDFLTVIAFLMIHPFLMFRWRMEHYYSAMFTVFCLIIFDVLWLLSIYISIIKYYYYYY